VYVEKLNIRGMSRSARGTEEEPGRNVKAKSGLNKSILDQGWYEFKRQLDYKLDWKGGSLVEANYHSSLTGKEEALLKQITTTHLKGARVVVTHRKRIVNHRLFLYVWPVDTRRMLM
jgi:hypothetical protein